MSIYVPKQVFFTTGVGKHKEKLTSFELALRDAGVAQFNIVQVSSIFPPYAKIISRKEGLKRIGKKAGGIIFSVVSKSETNEPHRLIAASIGIALPKDKRMYGYLSEHHSYGQNDETAGDYAEDLAAGMLATTLGIPFDLNADWNERKEQYKIGGNIVTTRNITQSSFGHDGWTTVLALAIMI